MPENEQFRVRIRKLEPANLSSEKKLIISAAAQFFEMAFRSDYFRQRVEEFGNSERGFEYAYGRTNREVYTKLIRAVEGSGNVESFTADLYLKIIPGNSPNGGEIGYVIPGSRTICTYEEFLSSMNVGRLAAHFAHEWTHVMGYSHPEYSHELAHQVGKTIPYAVQHFVMDYADKRLRDFILDHRKDKDL